MDTYFEVIGNIVVLTARRLGVFGRCLIRWRGLSVSALLKRVPLRSWLISSISSHGANRCVGS